MNKEDSQFNQDAVTITQTGSNIIISGHLSDLRTFSSTNPSQGSAKWVGIDLGTNLSTIEGATWNGSPLTADDVAESASVGLGVGHIIFWGRADSLALSPKTITIGAEGYESAAITVSFVEAD